MTFETYDCEMCVWSLMNEWLRMNVMAQQRLFKSSDSLWYFKEDCYLMIINAQTRFLSNACQGDSVPRVLNMSCWRAFALLQHLKLDICTKCVWHDTKIHSMHQAHSLFITLTRSYAAAALCFSLYD